MNELNIDHPVNSDNPHMLLKIQSRILSIQAEHIDETVEKKTTINLKYKQENIRKFKESYEGPYTVNQQNINTKIKGMDKRVIYGNYTYNRKGNTYKFTTLGSVHLCLGINVATRIGILGTFCLLKDVNVIGAAAKLTGLGISVYGYSKSSVTTSVQLAGIYKETCKFKTINLDLEGKRIETIMKRECKDKQSMINTVAGTRKFLYA